MATVAISWAATWVGFRSRIRHTLGDTNDSDFTWTNDQLMLWARDAINIYSRQFPCTKETTITPVSETRVYDLPSDFAGGRENLIHVEYPENFIMRERALLQGQWRRKRLPYGQSSAYLDPVTYEVYTRSGTWKVEFHADPPWLDDDYTVTYNAIYTLPAADDTTMDYPTEDESLIRSNVVYMALKELETRTAESTVYMTVDENTEHRVQLPVSQAASRAYAEYQRLLNERQTRGKHVQIGKLVRAW